MNGFATAIETFESNPGKETQVQILHFLLALTVRAGTLGPIYRMHGGHSFSYDTPTHQLSGASVGNPGDLSLPPH